MVSHSNRVTDFQIARLFLIKIVELEKLIDLQVELLRNLPGIVAALDRVILGAIRPCSWHRRFSYC